MELSIPGAFVCLALLTLGYALGAPLIIALFGSLAFGSTAIASVGGSTIPIHVVFAVILLAGLANRPNFVAKLLRVLEHEPLAQLTCALVAYAVATAFILPRLFASDATIIVPIDFTMIELPLRPVPGNFNQSAYLILNGLLFLGFTTLLDSREADIRRGFLAWACLQALLGLTDVVSKTAGLGDVLDPVRTSGYANLGDHAVWGFWRIVGAFPEASTYAVVTLQAFAFTLVDWRLTRSRLTLCVTIALLLLLIFSTSSTAYVGLGALLICVGGLALISAIRGRIFIGHLAIFGVGLSVIVALVGLCIYDEHLFDPWVNMVLDATLNKPSSDSGIERAYWNQKSLEAFVDTHGIGIGFGSSRSSSWPLSVLSQLGVIGAAGFVIAVCALVLGSAPRNRSKHPAPLAASASAAALAGVVATSFAGSGADPGTIFFIALAVVSARLRIAPVPQYR